MQNYAVVRKLGAGACGEAWLVKRKSDGLDLVVKKTLQVDAEAVKMAQEEAKMLSHLHHPNIIECYETFMDGDQFCIVTEFATGDPADLDGLIKKNPNGLPYEQVVEIARQMASALSHVHHRDIIHRDIKPANVFRMSNGSVKIGDFGVGRLFDGGVKETARMAGTPLYMAPCMFAHKAYNKAVDIWALGVMLFQCLTGSLPFENIADILLKAPPSLEGKCPAVFAQLIASMLDRDPAKRPGAHRIYTVPAIGRLPMVVWWDPQVFGNANRRTLAQVRADPNLQGVEVIACETREEALEVVNGAPSLDLVYVITNRGHRDAGPLLHEECRRLGVKNPGLVFCNYDKDIPEHLRRRGEIFVDKRDWAVQDYIWNVPLKKGSW